MDGYDGDHESRNELNFAEFKPETFDHKDSKQWRGPGKYDNAKVSAAINKAGAAEKIARATLRTNNDSIIEAQALDLMALPDRILVSTLKRLNSVSPNSLPKNSKFKRAMACCKFAADFLGRSATETGVEKLGNALMKIDDPSLKNLFMVAASIKVADSEEVENMFDGAEKVLEEAEEEEEEEEEEKEEEECCLSPEDMGLLKGLLEQERVNEEGESTSEPTGELTELFMEEEPEIEEVAIMASGNTPSITFGEDNTKIASSTPNGGGKSDLSELFDDHPEVVAQREIKMALDEQRAREGGYGVVASKRVASGAKKLGMVRGGSNSDDDALSRIWNGPG